MVNGHVNIDCVRAPSFTLWPVLRLQELGKNAPSFLLHQHDRYAADILLEYLDIHCNTIPIYIKFPTYVVHNIIFTVID